MNYFRLYIGDYQRDTAALTLAEHGAYLLMMQHFYATERPLPAGKALHRLLRCESKSERDAVDSVVARFWVQKEEGLVNERALEEFAKAGEISATNRAIALAREAKKRAHREHERSTNGARSVVDPCHEQSTNHNHNHNHQNPKPSTDPDGSVPLILGSCPEDAFKPPLSNTETARVRVAKSVPVTQATWLSYASAYIGRYGVEPVRNAKVNGQLKQLVGRLGAEEAPHVAAWYVAHNGQLYVRGKHPVDLLLRDCEGLRTEWARGQQITDHDARQVDRKQTNLNAFAPLIAEAEARERAKLLEPPDAKP
ncbi:MAG: YdaU family protein [Acidithiobacillus sp.]